MHGLALLIAIVWPDTARPATAVLGAGKDNAIFQENGGNSAGGSPGIQSGANADRAVRRGLVAFDVAGGGSGGGAGSGGLQSGGPGDFQGRGAEDFGLYRAGRGGGGGGGGG